ncbi:MAG TPA: hypothetical protein VHS96_02490, partial [Bacteroidia bacterium]|nr:hypothetical protein [Bacteroidia bacterium]
ASSPLGRQFAVYKNLLYHAVLRSLQSYTYECTPAKEVRSGIDKVEVLVEKGHHAAAYKMLLRTRELAEAHSVHGGLLELMGWDRRLLRYLQPMRYLEELPRIEAYERKMMRIVEQEMEAISIYDRLFAWVQVERRMEKTTFSLQLEAIGKRMGVLEEALYPAFGTTASLLNAKALFRQLHGDYQGMMDAYSALLAHWDSHPQIKKADPQRYARLQIAWLNSTLAAGQIGQHLATIRALRKIPIQGMTDRARTIFQSYNLELLWLMDQKDVATALRFLPAFEQRLPDLLPFLDDLRLNSFFLNAAMLYFRGKAYKEGLAWAMRLISRDNEHRETVFFRSAILLALVCNCELGNLNAAETQLGTLSRRLSARDADWEFGKIVVEWMKRLLPKWGLPEFDPLKQAFHAFLVEMEGRSAPVPMVLDLIKDWAGT